MQEGMAIHWVTLSPFILKWTRCGEVGGWLGTLMGLEPDIMYAMCPSRRANDKACPVILVWVFWLYIKHCLLGRFGLICFVPSV